MRIVPLIPLACLGLGAALVETISQVPETKATREFGVEIDSASVNAFTMELWTKFRAERLVLGPNDSTAFRVVGSMSQEQGERNFTAERMSADPDTGGILLNGNVRMWSGDETIETNRALVLTDGSVSGDDVHVSVGNNSISADGFSYEPGGKLTLEGRVRGSLGN